MIKEMNSKQEAKLNMNRAVEQHIDDNAAIIAASPAFQTAFTKFKANIAAIQNVAQQKSAPLTGIAVDKINFKQTLCNQTVIVAGYIYAYAAANKNNTLKNEMDLSVTKLMRTRDEELAPRCQNVHAKGNALQADLADYGVTKPLLAGLQTAINNYAAQTPKPRTAVSNRKTATGNIAALFKENDEILADQMDRLIEQFRADHPDFVNTYFSTRIIVDPPAKSRKLNNAADEKDGSISK